MCVCKEVDASCFFDRYANFEHTNLGMPKFNLTGYLCYKTICYHKDFLPLVCN